VLDPAGSFSTALPRTPVPELVTDPATRDMVVAACHRAGLLLNEDQIAMICAAAPCVTAMTQWLRRERNFRDEPANIFQFPSERRPAGEGRLTRPLADALGMRQAATPEGVRKTFSSPFF
jgi:hypothetical protein